MRVFCKQSFRFSPARAKLKIRPEFAAHLSRRPRDFSSTDPAAGRQAGAHTLSQLQLRTAPDVLAMTVSFNDFLWHARSLARATRLARQKLESRILLELGIKMHEGIKLNGIRFDFILVWY